MVGVRSTHPLALILDNGQAVKHLFQEYHHWYCSLVNTIAGVRSTSYINHKTPVAQRYYLNQGAQGWCETGRSTSDPTITESEYCQWEAWFVADVSGCLELQDPERVRVLFVKRAAADAVLVHFRIGALKRSSCRVLVGFDKTNICVYQRSVQPFGNAPDLLSDAPLALNCTNSSESMYRIPQLCLRVTPRPRSRYRSFSSSL